MSYRARRVLDDEAVRTFPWGAPATGAARAPRDAPARPPIDSEPAEPPGLSSQRLAVIEREAFAQGFAQGERAGLEAGQRRADAMLQRLESTISELAQLKGTLARQVERQAVELAIAVARKIVQRELSLDPELVAALVRVALDRLGGDEPVTVRLHPEQHAAIVTRYGDHLGGAHVRVLAHDRVPRGGCIVESSIGFIDAGIEAQLQELTRALLGDDAVPAPMPSLATDDRA